MKGKPNAKSSFENENVSKAEREMQDYQQKTPKEN
jgi:hypothetical protein